MPDPDSSSGGNDPVPGELRRRAQDSVRQWVASAGERERAGQERVTPTAAITAVAIAVCVPVVGPLLAAGGGTAAVAAALAQVGGVGTGLLAEAVIRAWDRVRSRDEHEAGGDALSDELSAELKAALTTGTETAAALRAEIAGLLRGVEAVQVALTATVEESAAGVQAVLVRGLQELGAELGWALEDVSQQLSVLMEDVTALRAAGRDAGDLWEQMFVQMYVMREETRAALGYRLALPGGPGEDGPSGDEERAAALDATGIVVSLDCPYPGLATFQPGDAGRFFGREALTATLAARAGELLSRPGLLMVLGPSGSGKSSLLRAGLIPAIAAGALPARGSWAWPWELMTPGREPVTELAILITTHTGIPPGALAADLRTDPARVTAAIRQALLAISRRRAAALSGVTESPVEELRLVLVVDQFEEVFTLCKDEERRAFIKALCAAAGNGVVRERADARDAPALVVLGVRADFYARCAQYPELVPYLQDKQVLVGPISQAGLREAIERPAAAAGLVTDSALVEVLLADLGLRPRPSSPLASSEALGEELGSGQVLPAGDSYEAGRLPLLAYALQQTWRYREGRRLTVAAYWATGGIDGAVARTAETVYKRFDADGKRAARLLLLRLVSPGEGTADTRRRVTVTELTGATELAEPMDTPQIATAKAVLTDLVQGRLLTAGTGTGGKDTVEISHEALLTAWPRLREWLSQDRAGQRIHRDLTDAVHSWQAQGRDPSLLFRGTRLAGAREWAASHGRDLNPDERAFLAESQQHVLRATWLRRAAVAGLAVLMLVAVGFAVYARIQRAVAVHQRDVAVSSQLAIQSEALGANNPVIDVVPMSNLGSVGARLPRKVNGFPAARRVHHGHILWWQ